MRKLETLTIQNFKSIREQKLQLDPLNVFIGSNGSGKSNLIEVFRFLREIVNQNLAGYTAKKGGADALLHFGRRTSPTMRLKLEFGEGDTSNAYSVTLSPTDAGELIIDPDIAYYHEKKRYPVPYDHGISSHARESRLKSDLHISARQIARDSRRVSRLPLP